MADQPDWTKQVGGAVSISSGTVTIDTSGGAVSVSGSVSITGTATVSVSNVPAVTISGTPTVAIAAAQSVSISGTVTVAFATAQLVTISGTPTVSISGTPAVTISGTATVQFPSAQAVTISGTPSVSISGTVTVAFGSTQNVSIANASIAVINASSTTIDTTQPQTLFGPFTSGQPTEVLALPASCQSLWILTDGTYAATPTVTGHTTGIHYPVATVVNNRLFVCPVVEAADTSVTVAMGAGLGVTWQAVADVGVRGVVPYDPAEYSDGASATSLTLQAVGGITAGNIWKTLALDSTGHLVLPPAATSRNLSCSASNSTGNTLNVGAGTVVRGISYVYVGTPTGTGDFVLTDSGDASSSLLDIRMIAAAMNVAGQVALPPGGYTMAGANLKITGNAAGGTGTLNLSIFY